MPPSTDTAEERVAETAARSAAKTEAETASQDAAPSFPGLPLTSVGDKEALVQLIRNSVIGSSVALQGPYGARRITYADYTASARPLQFIEDFIRDHVMPLYANTHTEASITGLQTTHFREEARSIIRTACGGSSQDCVLFAGSGATGAISKLARVLGLQFPSALDDRVGIRDRIADKDRPVVFVGPYEHHSNEVLWRETIAEVVVIDEDTHGNISLASLERALQLFRSRPLKLGSFSAASNVTGIVSDVHAIAALCHRYEAYAAFDYAAGGPYMDICMTPAPDSPQFHEGLGALDAVYLSPHKFVGGPGTPGVLLAKRSLLQNRVPDTPGGGTVWYVSPTDQEYIDNPEHREEGGTPAIIESIRAGLVFQLKHAVGAEEIRRREKSFVQRALEAWGKCPNVFVLGSHDAERLSIMSFVIRYPSDTSNGIERFLHHNFVVALLNDLFGIQARGGCVCAGPYGHRLLRIDQERSRQYHDEIARSGEGIKPGWVRINFNYFISDDEFQYVVDAVSAVARDGWKLLPEYDFNPQTGLWTKRGFVRPPTHSLFDISYERGRVSFPHRLLHAPASARRGYLSAARKIFKQAEQRATGSSAHSASSLTLCLSTDHGESGPGSCSSCKAATAHIRADTYEKLRWFADAGEATERLRGDCAVKQQRDSVLRRLLHAFRRSHGPAVHPASG